MISLKNVNETILTLVHKLYVVTLWVFYRLVGKSTLGVRAIVINSEQKVLLVKHTYQPGWYLPGGGVKKNEPFTKAISRELEEETGITIKGEPLLFGIYLRVAWGVADYPALYIIENFELLKSNRSHEIKQIGWFFPNQLPPDTTEATKRRLHEYFQNSARSYFW